MRILFVSDKCGYFGGVEQNVAATAAGLKSMGHHCCLAYGVRTHLDPEGYTGLFHTTVPCRELASGADRSRGQSFHDIVESVAPDAIYLHKVQTIEFCSPFLNKIRIVRMVHDHDLVCPRRHKFYFHNSRICRHRAGWRCYLDLGFLAPGTGATRPVTYVSIPEKLREMRRNYALDALLAGSRFMKSELTQNGFPEVKVHVVPPVVPMESGGSSPPPDEALVLCVAQLIKGKGVDLLLRALEKVTCRFRAVIVGTGNAESALRELSHTLRLGDRVHFQGWVDSDSIGEFYSRATVVAVPSRWAEPFGMIGLEAMNHGRPVVAFDVGGISDWLEHDVTGLLVPEQSIDPFAEALERILTDSALALRLGQQGRVRVQERFSFEDYLDLTLRHLSG